MASSVVPDDVQIGSDIADFQLDVRTQFERAATDIGALQGGARVSVLNFYSVVQIDDAASFQAAINTLSAAGGGTVFVPYRAGGYTFSTSIAVAANVSLLGDGKPLLTSTGTSGRLFVLTSVANVEIRGFRIASGSKASGSTFALSGATDCVFRDIDVTGARTCWDMSGASARNRVIDCTALNSTFHGVLLSGASCASNEVRNCRLESPREDAGGVKGGFGVIITAGANRNLVQGCRCESNGIELVGITQDSWGNRILGNHAENTGDNGISSTGYGNIISGNYVKGCDGNGIEVYGERNTVVGNTCLNNAKLWASNSGWRAGIAVQPSFGGAAQYNTIVGNILDDDQATKTQQYGIWLASTAYQAWGQGQTVAIGDYRYNAGNLYRAATAGTTGVTTPIHTTGTVSDGAVSWLFIRTFPTGAPTAGKNEIACNNVLRFAGAAAYQDDSASTTNEFIGGFQPLVLPSPLIVSQISNTGGVSSVTVPGTMNWTSAALGGALPLVTIAAPSGAGQQATAVATSLFLFGFGTIGSGGSGYTVGDVLTISGGSPVVNATNLAAGPPRTIQVTAVSGGVITSFTSGPTGSFYYKLPWLNGTALTGGTGTGATLNASVWQLGTALTVTAAGSGYASVPTVAFSPTNSGSGSATAILSSSIILNSGVGNITMDGTGTLIGLAGAGGAPTISLGALIDKSGVRQALTGSAYTVPANTSLVRFTQAGTIATQTVTLPTPLSDGQHVQFVGYAGSVTALTFSPAVNGWTNGSALTSFTGIRVRWDATAAAWFREQ